MPRYTMRLTWPDDPDRLNDYVFCVDGKASGRCYFMLAAFQREVWRWSVYGSASGGMEDTLERLNNNLRKHTMAANKKPTDTDRKIGALIRKHREAKGWALRTFADKIGVTYQQLQKYELAKSRVSASRLYDIAKVLNVPVASFFP